MARSKESERRQQEPARRYLGNYELLQTLGHGGSSIVYLARHRILARRPLVALKRLLAPLESEQERDRFIAEARLLETLDHPHILPILDAGIDETDCAYLVAPYAAGGSLRERLRRAGRQPLPLPEGLSLIRQIGEALAYAHGRGIIHRDLKPENILFDEEGQALLADFGLALMLGSRSLEAASISGTPAYMAPEQFAGQVSRQSDQYALACIAYELCSGRRPFEERDAVALMYCHTQREPLPPRYCNPCLPRAVESVILRGLAKERQQRYPEVSDFIAALLAAAGASRHQPEPEEEPEAISSPGQRAGAIWGEEPVQPGAEAAAESLIPVEREQTAAHAAAPAQSALGPLVPAWQPGKSKAGQEATLRRWRFPHLRRQQAQRPKSSQEPPQTVALGSRRPPRQARALLLTSAPAAPVKPVKPATLGGPKPARPQRPRGAARWRWLAVPMVLGLALVTASLALAYGDPAALGPLGEALPFGAPLATVHLRPASVALTRQYLVTGVTGQPDAAQRQIQARRLSTTARSQPQTVTATGHGITPGVQARGTITFFNEASISQTVPQGTLLYVRLNLSVVTDESVTLPPIQDLNNPPSATAKAHVIQPGAAGNLAAGAIHNWCCSSTTIWARSGAFTGGQDPQPYTFVQQSDIDKVATPLKAGLTQQAQQQLESQVRPGERLVGPDCSTSINSDHRVGDHVGRLSLSVVATCSGAAYNAQSALQLGAALLRQEAARSPGPAYALDSQLTATIADASLGQNQQVIVTVRAQGRWTYQFNEAAQQHLRQLIAGKRRPDALRLLQQQPGVAGVSLTLVRSPSQLLPADATGINIVIDGAA
ncbi:serine/threonine-protein kinase [Thermogemmatispora sp.]|uniref:serine/threonine-protein kinase n=1 Tax=Thermogemmatispora sp. TaxID=1968838 RepID=UPI0035E4428D